MRWIIGQIHLLWDVCKREHKPHSIGGLGGSPSLQDALEMTNNKAVLAGRTWRPWEHIYASKVNKGPFIPVYNPHGKYAVRLYFMVMRTTRILYLSV